MKKIMHWMLAAILICGVTAFTSCSDDDANKDNDLTIEKLVGVWVTDYSQSGTEGDLSWNRVVEDYKFDADGTGYYECYRLDGEKYVDASSVRDNDSLHFTISGNTVTITGDKNNMKQTLTYADGKLTVQGTSLTLVFHFEEDGCSISRRTAARWTRPTRARAAYRPN